MAVRIRSDRKTIVCAAKSRARKSDTYLDDGIHYVLAVELGVLSVFGTDKNGADLWKFHSCGTELAKEIADYLVALSERLEKPLLYGTYRSHGWDTGFRFPNGPDYRPRHDDIFVLRQAIDRLRQKELS